MNLAILLYWCMCILSPGPLGAPGSAHWLDTARGINKYRHGMSQSAIFSENGTVKTYPCTLMYVCASYV